MSTPTAAVASELELPLDGLNSAEQRSVSAPPADAVSPRRTKIGRGQRGKALSRKGASRQAAASPPQMEPSTVSDLSGLLVRNPERLHDLGREAERRRDWQEAEHCWRALLAQGAAAWWAFTALGASLRNQSKLPEATTLLAEAVSLFPDETVVWTDYAALAEIEKDWAEAARRWAQVEQQFPDVIEGPSRRAAALRAIGQDDASRSVLRAAIARFPHDIGLLHDLGRLAERCRDWNEAERCWRAIVAQAAVHWWAHRGLGAALREQGRLDEADAVFCAAMDLFPEEASLVDECANLAELRNDWPEALRRWAVMGERFPDRVDGPSRQAAALFMLGRYEEAGSVLQSATVRFPSDMGLHHQLGRYAMQNSDWEGAERAWRASLAQDVGQAWVHKDLAQSLINQNKHAAGLAVYVAAITEHGIRSPDFLEVALSHFGVQPDKALLPLIRSIEQDLGNVPDDEPNRVRILLEHARCAKYLGEFDIYRERAERLLTQFPDEPFVRYIAHEAREMDLRSDDQAWPDQAVAVAERTDAAPREVTGAVADRMQRFESLGGFRGGCELGLVQRACGIEPLGLLRWATIRPDGLIHGIEQEFQALHDPANIILKESLYTDWRVVDSTYGIRMDHTHLERALVDVKTAQRLLSIRMRILAKKLVADIKSGEKILAYRLQDETMDSDHVARLSRAISAHGDAKLLIICEDEAKSDGVEYQRVSDNTLVVTRPALREAGFIDFNVIVDSWVDISLKALEIFRL